jgi:hypothetical protein
MTGGMNPGSPLPTPAHRKTTMKKLPRHFALQAVVAFAALGASAGAHACHWYDVSCKARQAADAARAAADKVANDARAAADKAAAEAKAVADKAAADAAAAAAAAKAAADKFAADSANVSQTEMNNIVTTSKVAYSVSEGAVKSGYDQSVAALKAIYNAALEALFRAAGKLFISNEKTALKAIRTKMNNLDAEGTAALNRLKRALPLKQINDQTRADMALVGSKLGLIAGQAGANIPGNVTRSSWGFYTGVGAAAVAGVNESYGLIMNTFLENGKYSVGITQSVGGSLGASVGASGEAGIFWSPGSIDDASGASVGFGVEAALGEEAGGAIGLSWSVSKGMSGAQNAIPGISIAFSPGAELSAAFTGGWTNLVGKF